MDTVSFPSSSCFLGSCLPPPVARSDHNLHHPRFLPLVVNPDRRRRSRTATSHKNSSFCSIKASGRANARATGAPTSVPVRVAHELLLAGHRYLDVRTPEEFAAGHAPGAHNIPYMFRVGSVSLHVGMTKNHNFVKEVSVEFGEYDEIIIGCQLGKRSLMAATELTAAGFMAVTDIAGGFAAWAENGLPTEG